MGCILGCPSSNEPFSDLIVDWVDLVDSGAQSERGETRTMTHNPL
jgi:hypothetical protein